MNNLGQNEIYEDITEFHALLKQYVKKWNLQRG